MRYVIIGDGAAGVTAARTLRSLDPAGDIHILSDDPNPAYFRAALTNYLIGELREEHLFSVPPTFFDLHRIRRTMARVVGIDGRDRVVHLGAGDPVSYDRLLVASGSSPVQPSVSGGDVAGVMTMRTLQDARSVLDILGRLRRAVVVGGGPLGLEWAQGLHARGIPATYLVRGRSLLESTLDPTASDLLLSRLRAAGVDVRTEEEVEEAVADRNGRLAAVRLRNAGERLKCQLLGAAIGVRPNVLFLTGSGIAVDRGVTVDDRMQTSVNAIYAAGDVAEVFDEALGARRSIGLWEVAGLQARVAARNMAGGDEPYRLGAVYHATRLFDLDFAAVGDQSARPADDVRIDFPRGKGRIAYRKLILRDGVVAGACMLGSRSERVRLRGRALQRLATERVDVTSVADRLLDSAFDLGAWIESGRESHGAPVQEPSLLSRGLSTGRYVISAGLPSASVPIPAELLRPTRVGTLPPLPAGISRLARSPAGTSGPGGNGSDVGAVLMLAGRSLPITGPAATIGSDPACEIVLDDAEASLRHAQIIRQGGSLYVRDLGSRTGTLVNGALVGVPLLLVDGDVIRIGATDLVVRTGPGGSGLRRPAPVGLALSTERSRDVDTRVHARPGAETAAGAAASVVIVDGPAVGLRLVLAGDAVKIGREPDNDLAIRDQTVSRHHARLTRLGATWALEDLSSVNGTRVNDRPVPRGQSVGLQNGDLMAFGDVTARFQDGG
jgi:NADPH-dependent 2,4-dienoyl-CoA reductase/sulfur reductase-like enzyme/pSer/pThr/pTyr-binding forkhead associated (FHA) protein